MPDPAELHLAREVDVPYDQVEAALRAGPERWVPGLRRDGDRLTTELAYAQAGTRIERRIELEVGPVQKFAYGVTVHVRWRGAGRPQLYPELEGHLRAEPRPEAGSTLRFDVRYTPPAGRLGATVDRALMHRVAESSVRDFLDRVTRLLAGG